MSRRDDVEALPLYKQGDVQGPDAVKLSSNENPYPPLPSVARAVGEALASANRYPDMAAHQVREAIAAHHGVSVEEIAVGAGSTDVLSQLIHATAGAGDEVVFAWRSFEAYPILTKVAGATPVPVPLTADLRHDLPAMAASLTDRTRLVLLCTPNNPTGTALTTTQVEDFLARVPEDVTVVVDEAYRQFNQDPDAVSGTDLLADHPNVVSLQTFSKAYGLAGLRIGYAVSGSRLSDDLRRVATPFTVTNLAQRAAIASLAAGAELAERVDRIVSERERVRAALAEQGWPVVPSRANFLWLSLGEDTDRLDAALRRAGVFTRCWSGEGMRLSVGSPGENDRALAAFDAARQG